MSEFKKATLTETKSMPALIDPQFILGIGDVMAFGANKYGINNWKTCPPDKVHLYKDALLRHILAYIGGEQVDQETGLNHLYHAGCNLMFLNYLDRRDNEQK